MAAPFEFANLAPYQQAVANQLLEQSRIDPLQEMIKAANAGRDFRDAPRIAQQKALSEQLALEIQRANLAALDPNSPKNRMNMAMDQARLEALRRSVPTDLENAIQQSAQLALARQQGVVGAPQVAGMPATLPALPVSVEAQRAIAATPEDAPEIDQVISPLEAPVRLGAGQVFDPQTATAMRQRAASEEARRKFAEAQMMERAKPLKVGAGETVITERDPLTGEPIQKYTAPRKAETMKGYDTKTKTFGIFEADENGMFPKGVVPQSQAPKSTGGGKEIPSTHVESLTGLDILKEQLDIIKTSPLKVRLSNVGWLDSTVGAIQSVTGLGSDQSLDQNEAFRTAVDTLVGEFSFGRGGKSLTVGEKKVLKKYLPELTNSNVPFESRLETFSILVDQMKKSRLKTLKESGYNVSEFQKEIPVVTTQEEVDALESGDEFIEDGVTYTKP